jgi:formylglycine-generating enzyme
MVTESCCTSLEVVGGTFYRIYSNDGSGPQGEADPASVSTFLLDKYLVTVGRFRQFVGRNLSTRG